MGKDTLEKHTLDKFCSEKYTLLGKITKLEVEEKLRKLRRTYGRTGLRMDGPTDRRTDVPTWVGARDT